MCHSLLRRNAERTPHPQDLLRQFTHEMRFSIDVSIGFDLSDLRKDERPGVMACDVVDGI